MKTNDAISILNGCLEVLEVVKESVEKVEGDEICLCALSHSSLFGAPDHIGVAISRIKIALRYQGEAKLEQHNK